MSPQEGRGTKVVHLSRLWMLIVCLVLASGCTKDDRVRLMVYSPHGDAMMSYFEKAFEFENPSVDVRVVELGSDKLLGRIRAEKSNPICDVWWGAPWYMFQQAASEGLIEPYKPTWADQVSEAEHDPGDCWYGTFLMHQVILFNSEALQRSTAPQSWDELIDPRWKGKVIIRFPLDSGTMRTIFGAMVLRKSQAGGDLNEGYRWLASLDVNTKEYASDPVILYNKIARREGLVSLWNLTDVVLQASQNKFPFDYIIPREGTPVLVDGIALVAGSDQPELGRKFYEYVTSLESQISQANRFYRFPSRQDFPPEQRPRWMKEFLEQHIDMEVDWKELGGRQKEIMEYWNQHIRGRGAEVLKEPQGGKDRTASP